MISISIYDDEGFIVINHSLDDTADPPEDPSDADVVDMIPAGGGYVDGFWDSSLYYIVSGTPTERPAFNIDGLFNINADGTDSVTITCPSGTVVTDHTAQTEDTTGAEDLVIKATIAGEFTFTISPPFPYLPVDIRVRSHAA